MGVLYISADGTKYNEAEYEEYEKQRLAREVAEYRAQIAAREQARSDAQRMLCELGQAYKSYTSFLKDNPDLCLRLDSEQEIHQQVYEKLLENLERAHGTPRCGYIKVNGVPCGSPRMKGQELCYAHQRMQAVRPEKFDLPPLEDANAIQLGLMQVARGLMDGQMDRKTASLMLYCLQIASSNVAHTNFEAEEE
ncbi:MAG TPA: hypothetical protein VFK06_14935 [Candidatus Angelobacter sp.]|nr:hypothetical protein [Candidatus Angelobacter sp.]